ncbi:MAG: 50S ribosomal protein L20, partial [Clostridia bacterium]|nr:50S ribosomal protein L20 [Clostridia bacterium]
MARIKGAVVTRARRKRVLKLAKGYWGAKSKHFKMAKQAVMKSGNYAYIGRRQKKRDFRKLWITRISAACRMNDINYSSFMNGLKKSSINL